LFTGNGALASFSSRIQVASALGLLTREQRANLDYIREIRNAFAHATKPIRFATPEIKAVCALLVIHSPVAQQRGWKHPRRRFLLAVLQVGREMVRITPKESPA